MATDSWQLTITKHDCASPDTKEWRLVAAPISGPRIALMTTWLPADYDEAKAMRSLLSAATNQWTGR